MKYFIYILVLVLSLSILISEESKKYSKLPVIGKDDFSSLSGEAIDFNLLYTEGPTLVSFWFLGCGPCVAEMKHLSKLNEKYKDTGFKVISINTDTKSKGKVKSFVKKKKYSFDMLFDLNGKNGLLKKLGSDSCPFTALVNTDGTIFSKHLGYERGDEIALEKEIVNFIKYNKKIRDEIQKPNPSKEELNVKEVIKAVE